ncbi:WAP four-disulfide core domain protein 5-like [Mytilus californianus]|uniref:WAP four-disulfide core domain protein 5-like n=1 Tax=Mytilus californianus TaxID=6549 RepID=UPI002246DCE3|nr:WAP four-disulfide core domain protein 5-like [Mytilus californianus]
MWPIWIVALSLIHYGYTQTKKRGVCPPILDQPIGFCFTALFSSNCFGDDANCPGNEKCCPTECRSKNCRKPLLKKLPGCPVDNRICKRYQQLCNSEKDCKNGYICCFNPSCGTSCKAEIKKIVSLSACTTGTPLLGINCGRSPNRKKCPKGYRCKTNRLDRFAFCCPV